MASDASLYGVGACILHKMIDGLTKPIAHVLRALLPAEKIIHKLKKRWGKILLYYNFKMVYLLSNKFSHADGLSRLIPKYKEPLDDTVIASLQNECELKITLCNSVWELPVTLDQIKQEALHTEYINRIKTKILEKDQRSTCYLYMRWCVTRERVAIPSTLPKRILEDFHAGH